MKYLVVRQPWASLIVAGIKNVENRPWATRYRGELVIVSSKNKPDPGDLRTARLIKDHHYPNHNFKWVLPRGAALGTVRLLDCRTGFDSHWAAAISYHWVMDKAHRFEKPVPFAAGRLGIFEGPSLNALRAPHDGSTRRVDARAEVADLMITRPGKWGNPYRVEKQGKYWLVRDLRTGYVMNCRSRRGPRHFLREYAARRCALGFYQGHIILSPRYAELPQLRGKRLGCFCRWDQKCHGDVLVKLVREGTQ